MGEFIQTVPTLHSTKETLETKGNHPQSNSVAVQVLFRGKTTPENTGKTR
jgi:hypothetical protein